MTSSALRGKRLAAASALVLIPMLLPVMAAADDGDPPPATAEQAPESAPGTWNTAAPAPNPDGRMHHEMAYAEEFGYLFVFGGLTERGRDNDVYWFDTRTGTWDTFLSGPVEPSPRSFTSLVWDAVNHRLVVFGGVGDVDVSGGFFLFGDNFVNDTWALNFTPLGEPLGWELLHDGTGIAPSRRAAHSAIYEPNGHRMIVYGGNDTAAGYAGLTGEIVERFTGVRTLTQGLNDVWSFDLTTSSWARLAGGPGTRDPAMFSHQAVYDPVNDQMVVAGGITGSDGSFGVHYNPETYSFSFQTNGWSDKWIPRGADPPAIAGGAYGYSAALGALVVTKGDSQWERRVDTRGVWALTLGPAGAGSEWRRLTSGGGHRDLPGLRGTVISDTGELTAFGGHVRSGSEGLVNDSQLASFDPATRMWKTLSPETETMKAASDVAAALDSDRRHMYVVGGKRNSPRVWDLDLAAARWERVRAGGAVPYGINVAAAYDSTRHRLYVYGDGDRRLTSLDVTDPAARWRRVVTAGDAPDLVAPATFYDPMRDRLVVVGGIYPFRGQFGPWQDRHPNASVFAVSLSAAAPVWRELDTRGNPPDELDRIAAAYDRSRDRIVVFGGRAYSDSGWRNSNDAHLLDFSARAGGVWRHVDPSGTPPSARSHSVGIYDAGNDRFVVWGGGGADASAYALDFSTATPSWSKLATSNDPIGRDGAAGVYDETGRQMIVFGGRGDRGHEKIVGSRDTWALQLGGDRAAPPVVAAPEAASSPPLAPVRGGTWRAVGHPEAHTLQALPSVNYEIDQTIYAATVNAGKTRPWGAGISVSHDGGASWWSAGGDIQGAAVTRIAQAATNPARLYATAIGTSTRASVYTSTNGGATWDAADDGLPPEPHYALAVHPADPEVAWVGSEAGGLYMTSDGGGSWIQAGRGLEGQKVFGLTGLTTTTGLRLLAAARIIGSQVHGEGRVYVSDDLGQTWRLTYVDADYMTYTFAVDPSDTNRVLLAAGNGIWRSEDAGETWSHATPSKGEWIHAAALAFDPTSGGSVAYVAGVFYDIDFDGFAFGEFTPPNTPGLFRSTDGGRTWAEYGGAFSDDDFGSVAVLPDGQTIFAASAQSGIYKSSDGGATWDSRSDGFTHASAGGVAVDSIDRDHIVVAANHAGVYVTKDGGDTWENVTLADGWAPAFYVVASPVVPGRLLATNYNSVYKTEDGGHTWQDLGGRPNAQSMQPAAVAFDPVDPNKWYVTHENGEFSVVTGNGSNWETHEVADVFSCLIPIAVNPQDTQEIFTADGCGYGIFRSNDGGQTWTNVSTGLEDGSITALAINPANPDEVWAGTLHQGVYVSSDGGNTWRPSRAGLGYRYVKSLAVDPTDPRRVYAATEGAGVFESDDSGATWTSIMDGLNSGNVIDLKTDAHGRVFATTDGGGLSVLDPGATDPAPTPSTASPTPTPTASPTPTPTSTASASPTPSPTAGPSPAPAAPSELTARAASSNRIELSWTDNSADEAGFALERSTDGSTWQEIASTGPDATTYLDVGLEPGTTYSYRVRAFNAAGRSPYSNVAAATTAPRRSESSSPRRAPAAPSELSARAASGTRVELAWRDNATDEDGFAIERATNGSAWQEVATTGRDHTTYLDAGLAPGTTYSYRVRAYNSAGHSFYSNVATATTDPASGDDPPAPSPSPTEPVVAQGEATPTIAAGRAVVQFNRGFELSGSVDHDGACSGPLEVDIKRRIHGTDTYEVIATTPVTGNGTWGLRLAAQRNASYIAQVRDTRDCRGQASVPIDVLVRVKVAVDAPRACTGKVELRGRVLPNHATTEVIVQQRERKAWRTIDSDLLDARSRFVLQTRGCGLHRVVWRSQSETNERGAARVRI